MSIIVTKDPADLIWPDDFINKVICGDCLEVMKKIPDGAVDLVLTDPPYGVNLGNQAGSGNGCGLKHDGYASHEDTYENFVTLIVPRLNLAIDKATRSIIWTGPIYQNREKLIVWAACIALRPRVGTVGDSKPFCQFFITATRQTFSSELRFPIQYIPRSQYNPMVIPAPNRWSGFDGM